MMPVYYTVDNVVEEVTPNSDFTLDLVFSSGERRRYDCDKLWTHESFWRLQDPDYFATARVFCGAVWWGNYDMCVAPSNLLEDSVPL